MLYPDFNVFWLTTAATKVGEIFLKHLEFWLNRSFKISKEISLFYIYGYCSIKNWSDPVKNFKSVLLNSKQKYCIKNLLLLFFKRLKKEPYETVNK